MIESSCDGFKCRYLADVEVELKYLQSAVGGTLYVAALGIDLGASLMR